MQQHGEHLEEELKQKTEKLRVTEKERDRALDELKDVQKLALEANMKLSETMSPKKVAEIKLELSSVQDSLSIASQELKLKEKDIESLKLELEKAKGLELKMAESNASLQKLKMELSTVTTSEANARALLSESKIRIQELEAEIKKGKESDMKTFDSLVAQTKQLEQTKILLEESKLEVASLREEMKKLEGSSGQSGFASQSCPEDNLAMQKALESLRSELLLAKEHLAHAQEGEKIASLKGKTFLEEMELLKNELKLATELEGNDKKAMDDLALALKEVAAEATREKENLGVTQAELEYTKEEAENLKLMLKSKEEKYEELLGQAMKEADQYKNTAERLRLEAEDSLMAWNAKETGFVDCIKRAEEERFAAQAESSRLLELLTEEEKKTMASKEENQKLRDIFKQALNEANVAKEAAAIARDENSQLKDSLAEKEDALDFLTRENENLSINHAAAFENIKGLKRLLSETVTKELEKEEKDKSTKAEDFSTQNSANKEHIKDGNLMNRAFSLNHKELKPPNKHKDLDGHHEMDGALRGSIFGTLNLPDSTAHFSKKPSSVFTDGGETVHPGDFDSLDKTHFEDLDNDKNSRKKRALLRRFGDLMRRRNFQRKETIIE